MLHHNYSIAKHNSWRIGGTVEVLAEPTSKDEIIKALSYSKSLPIIWLGLGSNVLFQDQLLPAMVIKTQKALSNTVVEADRIYAQAGVTCAKVSKLSTRNGLLDLAFFAGVPGTIGGALAMNAGAFGQETWDYVDDIEWLWPNGQIDVFKRSEFEVGYRFVKFPIEGCFHGAWFNSKRGCPDKGKTRIKELLQKRSLSQPIGEFSCGSVFKNPHNGHAAWYIEQAGLKGLKIGGAMISTKHANFIVNYNKQACSQDVLDLVKVIKETVYSQFNVKLDQEFHWLGEESL